jgi:hypothetical protein
VPRAARHSIMHRMCNTAKVTVTAAHCFSSRSTSCSLTPRRVCVEVACCAVLRECCCTTPQMCAALCISFNRQPA